MKKQIRKINKEIDSLDELKNVKETAKFVFDRVVDGKMYWYYGQDDDRNHCNDETKRWLSWDKKTCKWIWRYENDEDIKRWLSWDKEKCHWFWRYDCEELTRWLKRPKQADDDVSNYNDEETGIFVDLVTGRVFATTCYKALRSDIDEDEISISNITDRTFFNLAGLLHEKYTVEHVEYAILSAVSMLRCRFFTQGPKWEDYGDVEALAEQLEYY